MNAAHRLVLLTTDTLHHCLLARAMALRATEMLIIEETHRARAPFDTHHPFENDRESYELQRFFAGKPPRLGDYASTLTVPSVNDGAAVRRVVDFAPDLVFCSGTGLIGREMISALPGRLVNFHGGNPEEYRGLDSHLWAIYHRDAAGLVVAMHFINERLDDGELLEVAPVKIEAGMELHQLRSATIETCCRLLDSALRTWSERGALRGRPQIRQGRYYSFMPTALKGLCLERFRPISRGR